MAWCAGGLGFKQNWSRVRTKNEGDLGLKQGNVTRFGATSRRSREEIFPTSRRSIQRRDIPTSRRCNIATLRANVATLQRRLKMKIKEPWSRIRENSPRINVHLWTFVKRYMNRLSPVLLIAGPEIIQPKRDTDYGQNIKSK